MGIPYERALKSYTSTLSTKTATTATSPKATDLTPCVRGLNVMEPPSKVYRDLVVGEKQG